jgi:hypothetical protein
MSTPPFSARNAGSHRQIDRDLPDTARVALVHLLYHLVEHEYVEGWPALARELQRIARIAPSEYRKTDTGVREAQAECQRIVEAMAWDKALDFTERLHSNLVQETGFRDQEGEWQVTKTRKDVQSLVASELQTIFLEEGLAFEYRDGVVQRRGRKLTVDRVSRAEVVLGDPRLDNARRHYAKALQFFRDPSKADYQNVVKEAVCAVEAAGKALFPEAKAATLGDLTKWLVTGEAQMPKSLAQTFSGMYGFRSGGEGVGHGGASGGKVTAYVAEYTLGVTASQIIYMVDLANAQEPDIPF